MKILIIGSEGFIGKQLYDYFKLKGNHIHRADIINIISKGYTKIEPLNPDYEVLFSTTKWDVCINASGSANVQASFLNPSHDYLLNTYNVKLMLKAIHAHQPNCKFINFSSAAVYGNPNTLPISEEDSKNSIPLSPYGWHKAYSETLLSRFSDTFGLKTCSLRIFSAFGLGQKKLLLWDILRKCQESDDGKISLFGTGNESRDYIMIHDLIRAVEIVTEKSEFNGETINLASGQEISIRKVAELAIGEINPKIRVEFTGNVKQGDPKNWKADISKLKKLGFSNEISIEEGINNYYKWAKTQIEKE
ncbi:MAG: UDP-glucose 4-epimerase [Arenicella sp.]|jgi:UDP-glucose 4-epimerase